MIWLPFAIFQKNLKILLTDKIFHTQKGLYRESLVILNLRNTTRHNVCYSVYHYTFKYHWLFLRCGHSLEFYIRYYLDSIKITFESLNNILFSSASFELFKNCIILFWLMNVTIINLFSLLYWILSYKLLIQTMILYVWSKCTHQRLELLGHRVYVFSALLDFVF